MKERYVLEALQKAIIAAVAPTSISVKYVGRIFNPPSDGKWLEIVYIPNNVENQYWDKDKTYRGIIRLILHWPMDDTGAYPALTIAEQIVAGLEKGSKFSDLANTVVVTISENPNIQSVLEESPDLLIPISIRYTCFTT